jgi:hypothetical protein
LLKAVTGPTWLTSSEMPDLVVAQPERRQATLVFDLCATTNHQARLHSSHYYKLEP